ncbi:hypothetical protein GB931_20295 [Modestobacter sp. I12A-02628]|uniref:Uncharacterized protein n=1 Tax=Goekera deserti TaxID=2497753 RepID=A0A7K3W9Q1_9ACTN|nr:hypothetical protein [Goekera deserti]MPR00213.1 hypothetical protein [Goekera deserti]NDI49387.1 hypothetical protein [Goekera deserti]NEL52739.1 hypothetical protein [Goekera deserti]
MSSRTAIGGFWDAHIRSWLDGADPLPDPLDAWFGSYSGRGLGAVTRDGFVEPFQGDLGGHETEPRMVLLGLNPGQYLPDLQARDGLFAEEIRAAGSYSAWARSAPYDRDPWLARYGPNRFYRGRRGFTRRWLGDPAAGYNDMLLWELYPWHSTAVVGRMSPPPHLIRQFVWDPIADIDVRYVFAFGAPWAQLAESDLKLQPAGVFGRGGRDYGSTVASRSVRVFELSSRQLLVTESHAGSAGPPSTDEVERLRDALVSAKL